MLSAEFGMNSVMCVLFCDFLRSAQRILLFLVPNDRLPRYLHLVMWFACFGGVCVWTGGHPTSGDFGLFWWGLNGLLVRHTELFRYVVFAQFCVFGP